MARFLVSLSLALIITVCNVTQKAPIVADAKFFEYELPNRTVTICPTYSLISLECPQIPISADHHGWHKPQPPQYFISIDYIRSFPSRIGLDPASCQPDLAHACHNYDLRYMNTLCNGKAQCPDIPAYQVRDRSLCAFKAVTEIGYHCVPTWHMNDIQTKCDICKNGSLTNDYGFIYSRNYPLSTLHITCFTTIYARPNHKTILYFVNGQLNFDQLRIESVSAEGITILNLTLNGNLSTQRLAASTYEMRITFLPGHVYSHQPTYYLLYFYTIPFCSITEPCPLPPTTTIPLPPTTTTRERIQSIGWTRIPNIWIVIPIILAYILLLLLVIVLALLFQRRRRQRKALESGVGASNLSSRYLDTSGTSSRAQLVTPLPPVNGNGMSTQSSRRRQSISHDPQYPPPTGHSFAQNMDRYHRESRSDFDLYQSSGGGGVDYRHHSSIPYRSRPAAATAGAHRPYGTMDYPSYYSGSSSRRRSLPKSFSDCDLCKRRVVAEEYDHYHDEDDDNWHLENTLERRSTSQPRAYREKIKERFRERLTVRKIPDTEILPPTTAVEYSTVLPRHQRSGSESNRAGGTVHHLPFEYIPNETNPNVRTVEYKRNANQEHLAVGGNQHTGDENGTTNFTVKFYEHDNDDENELDRRLHEAREVQEMSMRMSEQQNVNSRHQYYHHQQRRYTGASSDS